MNPRGAKFDPKGAQKASSCAQETLKLKGSKLRPSGAKKEPWAAIRRPLVWRVRPHALVEGLPSTPSPTFHWAPRRPNCENHLFYSVIRLKTLKTLTPEGGCPQPPLGHSELKS